MAEKVTAKAYAPTDRLPQGELRTKAPTDKAASGAAKASTATAGRPHVRCDQVDSTPPPAGRVFH
ncbi:hypothetical protein ACFFQW_48510 [Umezawaea endophytica]|uniref:Uncharacterized protein n=1 Tax=Umezawaea endophytica TaxID=1654476 RepID=A0A9X2VV81_9PSEU|nr:hypothetical protein [Umezawaea endophytica]MCS7483441.1 hypothetical protein [Umezawaea endophytica]